jgi:hypothetical protein
MLTVDAHDLAVGAVYNRPGGHAAPRYSSEA